MDWTLRLDDELDVLKSMGPKDSYKCDLTNLLVPLIMLSLNHQNHKQWPKWGHVPYTVADISDVFGTMFLIRGIIMRFSIS